MPEQRFSEARQLYLFAEDDIEMTAELNARLWRGSFNSRESTLQQLSPYVGKLKSGMVKVLISLYSQPGETVLDPFCGSGVVPLEAVLAGRRAWANDLSPYAYVLTHGKLEAPGTERAALERAKELADMVEQEAPQVDLSEVPEWVQEFFHPDTLREILVAFRILRQREDYFLMACLLGILHHVRPGFLSYPASHLVPYLRKSKYPPDKYPQMYTYRDLRSRLLAKVKRAYRRHMLPAAWEKREYRVWQTNAMSLPIGDATVDAIISSPPYFGALDYARDNRLRLWFPGCEDWKELVQPGVNSLPVRLDVAPAPEWGFRRCWGGFLPWKSREKLGAYLCLAALDASLTANNKVYLPQMSVCLKGMDRVLREGGYCVLVLGDVERDGKTRHTAEVLADLAVEVTNGRFVVETIYDDRIPDERRSRRRTKTTKFERILVMRKA